MVTFVEAFEGVAASVAGGVAVAIPGAAVVVVAAVALAIWIRVDVVVAATGFAVVVVASTTFVVVVAGLVELVVVATADFVSVRSDPAPLDDGARTTEAARATPQSTSGTEVRRWLWWWRMTGTGLLVAMPTLGADHSHPRSAAPPGT